jgi:hypothetical protein
MSDHWRKELHKLRRLEAPEGLWRARLDGAANPLPQSPRGVVRGLVVTLALAVGLGGVAFVGYAFWAHHDSRTDGPLSDSSIALAVVNRPLAVTKTGEIPIQAANGAVSGGGAVWIGSLNEGSGSDDPRVVRIDPTTGSAVASIPTVTVPTGQTGVGGMAFAGEELWITGARLRPGGPRGAVLTKIDAATNSVSAEIPLDGQEGVDVAANGQDVWVLVRGDANSLTIVKLDALTNRLENVVPIGVGVPRHIALTGGYVVATALATDGDTVGQTTTVTAIDASTAQLVAQEVDPRLLFGLASGPDGRLWVAYDGGLQEVAPSTGAFLGAEVPVDMAVDALVTSPDGLWFFGPNDSRPGSSAGLFDPSGGVMYGPATLPGAAISDLAPTHDGLWLGSHQSLVSVSVSTG